MRKCTKIFFINELSNSLMYARLFSSKNQLSHPLNTNDLLEKAKTLEEQLKISEAAKLYEKIIFEEDPSCKEAYDKIMGLWLTYAKAKGLKRDILDRYLAQYDKFIDTSSSTTSKLKHLT